VKQEPEGAPHSGADRNRLPSGRRGRQTCLQPARLFQTIGRGLLAARESGVFGEPFSRRARIGWVDYRDVAEAAAIALTEDRLHHGAFELCAEEGLDREEIAAVTAGALGRPVTAAEPGFEEWARAVGPLPYDDRQLGWMAEMLAYYDRHGLPGNSLVLRGVLGREPRTLRRYVDDLVKGVPTDAA
jgi:uncharacterized protein YbjT (DUF2867 family)